jgi:hypothetical protein
MDNGPLARRPENLFDAVIRPRNELRELGVQSYNQVVDSVGKRHGAPGKRERGLKVSAQGKPRALSLALPGMAGVFGYEYRSFFVSCYVRCN